jgi:hypothetical protein
MQTKWVKEMQTSLMSLDAFTWHCRDNYRRSGEILLWSRVQQSRLSISATGRRLERGGTLV